MGSSYPSNTLTVGCNTISITGALKEKFHSIVSEALWRIFSSLPLDWKSKRMSVRTKKGVKKECLSLRVINIDDAVPVFFWVYIMFYYKLSFLYLRKHTLDGDIWNSFGYIASLEVCRGDNRTPSFPGTVAITIHGNDCLYVSLFQ